MPRRKNKANRRKSKTPPEVADSDTTSAVSDYSDLGSINGKEDATVSVEDNFKDLLDQMGQKRASTRVKALVKMIKLMKARFIPNEVEGSDLTLRSSLLNSIRGKDTKEAVLACDALGLFGITVGADSESLYEEFKRPLGLIANDHTKNGLIQSTAMRTLSLLCFLGCPIPAETEDMMKLALGLFKSKTPVVVEGALSAWTLLASTLRQHKLADHQLSSVGPKMLFLLDHKDPGVKESAGRAVALLCEALNMQQEETKDSKSAEDPIVENLMDDLCEKLSDLASVSSKSQNKKEKARQRASFRAFLRTAEDATSPDETLIINTNSIVVQGWQKCVQLAEFRKWLGAGLQTHLKENELLSQIFEYRLQELSRDEAKEIREDKIYYSKINARIRKENIHKVNSRKTQSLLQGVDDL